MREAVEDFESVAGDIHPDDARFIPFHTPFPGMVRKAAMLAYRHITRGTEIEEELAVEIGRQPRAEAFDDEDAFFEAQREYMDGLKGTDRYQEWYARTVEPTLTISREVGNWYTGSVHIARASALKYAYERGEDITGETLLVGSYGSGAQAEIHAEIVRDSWEEEISQLNVDEQLESRYELTWDDYEEIHDVHNHEMDVDIEARTTPEHEFVFDGWGRMGERKYRFVE